MPPVSGAVKKCKVLWLGACYTTAVKRIIRRKIVIEVVEVWALTVRDDEVIAEQPTRCDWQLQVTSETTLLEDGAAGDGAADAATKVARYGLPSPPARASE